MATTRSRPRGRESARPSSGGVVAEHAAKIYGTALGGIVVTVAFLTLTRIGHVVDAATQHFMLYYAGVFALIALCASVGLGLICTDRMVLNPGHRIFVQSMHRAASFGALAFLVIHIVTEILAQRVHVIDAFIPFLSPFKTFYIGLGTIASDLIVLLVITSILRKRFTAHGKAWRWRAIHYTAYVAFVFGIWHGLLGGRPAKPYVDWSYGFVIAFTALGLAVRVIANSLRPRENLSRPPVDETGGTSSSPLRAPTVSMATQFGGTARVLPAAGGMATTGQGMLPAGNGMYGSGPASGPMPALAALPAAGAVGAGGATETFAGYGGPPADGRQPLYEPGYEGPPRYAGAPRHDDVPGYGEATGYGDEPGYGGEPGYGADSRSGDGPGYGADPGYGDAPRYGDAGVHAAASGYRATRQYVTWDGGAAARRQASGGRPSHAPGGPLPRAATGPMPASGSGPAPRAAAGPVPGAGPGPMRRAATGPVPQVPGGPGTGPLPRVPGGTPRAGTGPMPAAGPGAGRHGGAGAAQRPATGPVPRVPGGPGTGPMPRADAGPRGAGRADGGWADRRWADGSWSDGDWADGGRGSDEQMRGQPPGRRPGGPDRRGSGNPPYGRRGGGDGGR